MKKVLILVLPFLWVSAAIYAQTCTSDPLNIVASANFSTLNWTTDAGAVCPPGSNFTGTVTIHLANGVNITMDSDITISGNFNITNNGQSTLTIPAGVDVVVNGDMGDADNNDVGYVVNGTLRVNGTLYGKNNNAFSGSGTISGGTLSVKNGTTCASPCPVSGGFTNCTSIDQFCTTNNVVTPIILFGFEAKAEQQSVQLNWTTISEENFNHFVVQRSEIGIDFEDIGSVPGLGKNIYDIKTKYSFQDQAPFVGWNYYRLKAVDLDNSVEYFHIVSAKFAGSKELAVYPNPSSGESISFRTNFHPEEGDRLILTNQLGIEMANFHATSSNSNIVFDTRLFSGLYMLKYISRGFEKTVKVVVKN